MYKWYNELPLAQLKSVCNPRANRIFDRPNPFCTESENSKTNTASVSNRSDYAQEALKLQDLNSQDFRTLKDKLSCCGDLTCQTWSCKTFLSRFNFEHCYSNEIAVLRKKFDMNY